MKNNMINNNMNIFEKFKIEDAHDYIHVTPDMKLAVLVGPNCWRSYNPETKDFSDVSMLNINTGLVYKLPSFELSVGDLIDTDGTTYGIAQVESIDQTTGKIEIVRYGDKIHTELKPESLQFMDGKYVYFKFVNLFVNGNMNNNMLLMMALSGSQNGNTNNLLLPLMMMQDGGNMDDKMLPMMLLMGNNQGQTADGTNNMNSLLPFFLLSNKGGSSKMDPMMLLALAGSQNGNGMNMALPFMLMSGMNKDKKAKKPEGNTSKK